MIADNPSLGQCFCNHCSIFAVILAKNLSVRLSVEADAIAIYPDPYPDKRVGTAIELNKEEATFLQLYRGITKSSMTQN
jgi:hypothetical protein